MSDRIIRIRAHLASLTAGGSDVEQEHTWRGRCAFLLRERDAAIARAEASEALAASRLDVSPEDAAEMTEWVRGMSLPSDDGEWERVTRCLDALRAHAAKVSR